MRPPLRLLAAIAATLAGTGCMVDDTPPGGIDRPSSCDNGTCEARENCGNCPEDCPCCVAVDVRGLGQDVKAVLPDAENATGAPDGRVVELGERADLFVSFGRDVFDKRDIENDRNLPDFKIHGEVTSGGIADVGTRCPTLLGDEQGFEVMVSPFGESWHLVGLWTGEVETFDLSCASLPSVRFARIKAQVGAAGTLDAITAEEGACRADDAR